MLYGLIFPLAFILSIGLSDIVIESIRRIPEASEFQFFWSATPRALSLLIAIVVMAWFPAWWTIGKDAEKKTLYTRLDIIIPLILGIIVLFLLFGTPVFSLAVGLGAGVFFLIFGYLLRIMYEWIFRRAG